MTFQLRMKAASKAAFFHLLGSLLVAALAAVIVFGFWYPYPYGQLSGGLRLFLILMGVDVVCGPLLTLILFSPKKRRREVVLDMSLVITVQLAALAYGLHTAYQARPLFLVHELDRFRVISLQDYQGVDVVNDIAQLESHLRPTWSSGPVTVGVREPRDRDERHEVMLDSVTGGRDYSQRPDFYIAYDEAYAAKATSRAKPLSEFVAQFPSTAQEVEELAERHQIEVDAMLFLPVLHRQEWVAVLNAQGAILGFLPGDGFAVTATKP